MANLSNYFFTPELMPDVVFERLRREPSPFILDVRTLDEFKEGRIAGTKALVPIDELNERLHELSPFKEEEIIVVCKIGKRSKIGCRILLQNGFRKVYNMTGGLIAYQELGYNLEKGRKMPDGIIS